jgi:hypothetical protein
MKQASVAGVLAICLGLCGCGRADRDRGDADKAGDKTAEVRPAVVTQTGCLTARGDQFVLTDLERGEGEATTETFQLIGNHEELRQHVGKQVRVSGEAEAPKVAVVQESTPPSPKTAPEGTSGRAEPKVTTQAETRVETRKLTVTSVQPTGASCAAETTSDRAPATRPRQ